MVPAEAWCSSWLAGGGQWSKAWCTRLQGLQMALFHPEWSLIVRVITTVQQFTVERMARAHTTSLCRTDYPARFVQLRATASTLMAANTKS